MSVKSRIEDAKVLWEAGRQEGAIIQVLIAVAATVQKRYPKTKEMWDEKGYKLFIRDEIIKITNGPYVNVDFFYNGEHHVPLEHIIYKFLRCSLVHEGCLPANITLTQPVLGDGKPHGRSPDGTPYDGKLFNLLSVEDVMGFPVGWVWNLIRVVAEAPENKAEFNDGSYPLPAGYSVSAGFILRHPDEHPERFPPNAPPYVATGKTKKKVGGAGRGKRGRK